MPENSYSVESSASPEAVWKLWSDTSTWKDWNPDVKAASVNDDFRTGTTGNMETHSGGKHEFVLEDVTVGHHFELVTKPVPLTVFHFRCNVELSPNGSKLTQSVRMTGPLAFFFSRMAGPQITKSFAPILDGLKAAAEKTA